MNLHFSFNVEMYLDQTSILFCLNDCILLWLSIMLFSICIPSLNDALLQLFDLSLREVVLAAQTRSVLIGEYFLGTSSVIPDSTVPAHNTYHADLLTAKAAFKQLGFERFFQIIVQLNESSAMYRDQLPVIGHLHEPVVAYELVDNDTKFLVCGWLGNCS